MNGGEETLGQWEQAEIERSRMQATLSADVLPTRPDIFDRYANPQPNTVFPLEYLFHVIGDIRGLQVLDYGCGDGADSALLAARGAFVHGLDLSADLLARAKSRLELDGLDHLVTFHCGSAHQIPLSDASIDVVIGHAVLHHLDLALSQREVLRVLKPRGRAIFLEPVRGSKLLRAIRPLIPYRQPDVSPFERPLLPSEIEAFSRPFECGRRREFMLPFVAVARVLGGSEAFQNRLRFIDRRLLEKYPALRFYATVTVFELFKPCP